MPLDDSDLRRFILEQGIEAELVYPAEATPTVSAAAAALSVPVTSIVKTLVFVAEGKPQLVIAAGESLVDYKKVAAALGVGRRALKMASADLALELTGFEVGAMPPFGHRQPLPTLIDSLTVTEPLLYGGGGLNRAMLKLSRDTLVSVTQGRLEPLMKPVIQALAGETPDEFPPSQPAEETA